MRCVLCSRAMPPRLTSRSLKGVDVDIRTLLVSVPPDKHNAFLNRLRQESRSVIETVQRGVAPKATPEDRRAAASIIATVAWETLEQ